MRKILVITALTLAAALFASGCGKDAASSSDAISASGKLEESSSQSTSESASSEESSSLPASESSASETSAPVSSGESSSQASRPVSAQSDDWKLILINANNPIDADMDIELDTVQGYKVDARMAPTLREMLAAATADGINLQVISGYRTMERSGILFNNEMQRYISAGYSQDAARTEAAKWVAPPGTSEHHSGLAVDIFSVDYYSHHSDFSADFENDPEGIWLRENAPTYGFILRYPKDKTDVTGIGYEPWHFRYVGVENAKAITDAGQCLEEYLESLNG